MGNSWALISKRGQDDCEWLSSHHLQCSKLVLMDFPLPALTSASFDIVPRAVSSNYPGPKPQALRNSPSFHKRSQSPSSSNSSFIPFLLLVTSSSRPLQRSYFNSLSPRLRPAAIPHLLGQHHISSSTSGQRDLKLPFYFLYRSTDPLTGIY